jgi:hypothetical protein
MRFLILIGLMILSSCKSQKIIFNFDNKLAVLTIPQKVTKVNYSSEEGKVAYYRDADSSILYLSFMSNLHSPNGMFILSQNTIAITAILPDTVFEGINQGKYWKEIKRGRLFYGYTNVPPFEKRSYDDALNSLRLKSQASRKGLDSDSQRN